MVDFQVAELGEACQAARPAETARPGDTDPTLLHRAGATAGEMPTPGRNAGEVRNMAAVVAVAFMLPSA